MLVEATDEHFAALISGAAPLGLTVPDGGVEMVEVLEMLRGLAQSVRQQIGPASWLIVADGEIVGLCSITKAFPTPGTIEIGYGLAQARRGRGHAAAAVAELLDWARSVLWPRPRPTSRPWLRTRPRTVLTWPRAASILERLSKCWVPWQIGSGS